MNEDTKEESPKDSTKINPKCTSPSPDHSMKSSGVCFMDSSGSKKGGTRNEWRPEGETYILTHKKQSHVYKP